MRAVILVPLALLAACANPGANTSDGRRPSLATRPGERIGGTVAPLAVPAPPPATAATGSRIAQLHAQAQAAHTRFAERRASVAALCAAAQGAPVASDAWSAAQLARAGLEATRNAATIALADLDSLYVAAKADAVATDGSGDVDAIGAARVEVIGWIGEQDTALAALCGGLRE